MINRMSSRKKTVPSNNNNKSDICLSDPTFFPLTLMTFTIHIKIIEPDVTNKVNRYKTS